MEGQLKDSHLRNMLRKRQFTQTMDIRVVVKLVHGETRRQWGIWCGRRGKNPFRAPPPRPPRLHTLLQVLLHFLHIEPVHPHSLLCPLPSAPVCLRPRTLAGCWRLHSPCSSLGHGFPVDPKLQGGTPPVALSQRIPGEPRGV